MSNLKHLEILGQSVKAWNQWRKANPNFKSNLSYANLSYADLSGANLRNANLSGVNLTNADLSGANLILANLSKAKLSGADLSKAKLSSAKLSSADLKNANLGEADLIFGYLSGADLSEASLNNANLSEADLSGVNLTNADLSGANLNNANLSEAFLNGANLKNAQINLETVIDGKWRLLWEILNQGGMGRHLSGADLSGFDLSGANLNGADLSNANLNGANLNGADLSEANLNGADLSEAKLSNANLSEAKLREANLRNAQINLETVIDSKWLIIKLVQEALIARQGKLDLRSEITNCNLTEIPAEVFELEHLEELDLRSNQLISIPEAIGKLINLTKLNLSHNQLTSVPDSIAKLTNLTDLDLRNNKLTSLPKSITKLTNLTTLYFSGNPLHTPPIEIRMGGIEAIRKYFRQLEEEGTNYLYEAKLLILGAGGAGKTTLAHKIINPNYKLNPQEAPTDGIDILQWSFKIEDKQGVKRDFRVNIWDFGGQEIYHTTHQFFLTKRSLYALVVDNRIEDNNFPYWLNIVELLSDKSPILVIKNEKNDRPCQVNESQYKGRFNNLKDSLSCNLATNRGLDDILKFIQFYIEKLEHIGDILPQTWKQVRDVLEKNKYNYISFQEYLKICEENGLKKGEDRLQLSGYLHDLGVILHFQEDEILSQTVILKPEWGTAAVYKVLENEEVINNLGKFSDRDLEKIWDEEQYVDKQLELLQLMKKFQLCYQLPETDGTYIAPQLLTFEKPIYDWDEDNNLLLRYSYEFMPKGIIARFIVAIHSLIEKEQLVWRSGVVLHKDETRAEVIEDYDRRKISIKVSGKNKKHLMNILIYELDKIHDSYHRLKYDKSIPCNCELCQTSLNPNFYELENLRERLNLKKQTIECKFPPYHTVQVSSLIEDYWNEQLSKEQTKYKNLMPEEEQKIEQLETAVEGKNIGENLKVNGFPIMLDNIESIPVARDKINHSPNIKIENSTEKSKITKIWGVAAIATIIALFFNGIFNTEVKQLFDRWLNKDMPTISKPE